MRTTTITIQRRAKTADRGPPEQPARIEIPTVEQLGPNMSLTKHGNLICRNVPIARVGWMAYGPDEIPIAPGPDGIVRVYRSAEELFKPETIGSFMGTAVVDEHPDEDVTPKTWSDVAKGFSLDNVRQGEGTDADVLLADLIITDEDLIDSILKGKREVSCGYDADYKATADGEGVQSNIIGNHIALVEKGRCGPRCAIGDEAFIDPNRKEMKMATQRVKITRTTDKRSLVRKLMDKATRDAEAIMSAGEGEEVDTGDDGETGPTGEGVTHIHIHAGGEGSGKPAGVTQAGADDAIEGEGGAGAGAGGEGAPADKYEERFGKIEASLAAIGETLQKLSGGGPANPEDEGAEEFPAGNGSQDFTGDKEGFEDPADGNMKKEDEGKTKTGDSVALATGYQTLLAQAEILVPGFRAPTFDSKAKRAKTVDNMCAIRRKVLDTAYLTADGKEVIDGVSGMKTLQLKTMDCKATATLFRAAAGAKALLNNRASTGDSGMMAKKKEEEQPKKQMTIADINKANAKFYEGKVAKG